MHTSSRNTFTVALGVVHLEAVATLADVGSRPVDTVHQCCRALVAALGALVHVCKQHQQQHYDLSPFTSELVLLLAILHTHTHTHTRARAFNGPFSWTTQVSRYQKGKTDLDFTEASEWQWHQLGHMQVCILLQTDNHASNPPLLPPNQQR